MAKPAIRERLARKVDELEQRKRGIVAERDRQVAEIDQQLAALEAARTLLANDQLATAVNRLVDLGLL